MSFIKYPNPLKKGSRIAITAFSSGVPESLHARLDRVIHDFRLKGFDVVEGQCLRSDHKHVSAPKEQRATELMQFLLDDSIDAVVPPWGGELAIEILPLLNFDQIKTARPKWILGFSDVSTITACLTTLTGWATMHCSNFMDLIDKQDDPLTSQTMDFLQSGLISPVEQQSSEKYQVAYIPFQEQMDGRFNLTEPTQWKGLNFFDDITEFDGRIIGGCLDTLHHLFATPYLDLQYFQQRFGSQKLILFFENVELSPSEIIRVLHAMSFRGIFDLCSGILIGRSYAIVSDNAGLSYVDALQSVLMDLNIPVIYDVDIGHQPPNLTLINGSNARVQFNRQLQTGSLKQWA